MFLLAHKVENNGQLVADNGTVGLGAAREILLKRSGDERVAVKISSDGSSVNNKGQIEAVQAELKAFGNNPYALAVNNSGLIHATGTETRNGRVYLSANSGAVRVAGRIKAENSDGTGGSVQITGDHIIVAASAVIDASGTKAGDVLIGGDFQGKGDLATAQTTTIEQGAKIAASASAGDGGRVIIWADDRTDFSGDITAHGVEGFDGGFVEVSGKRDLSFSGTVDTGGGTLLLDPTNIVIADSGGTMTPDTLTAALSNGSVILSTSSGGIGMNEIGGADVGNITFNSDVIYSFGNDLTLLAHNNVVFNASLQNTSSDGGDINIIAGWDGSTDFDPNWLFDESLSSTTVFGNTLEGIENSGSIHIGSGSQSTGTYIGSRMGVTGVYGQDLILKGSNSNSEGFAQLGYRVSNAHSTHWVEGNINVSLRGGISATAGSTDGSYVQVGHLGGDFLEDDTIEADVSYSAGILIQTQGAIDFQAGSGLGAYAQIGHGGYQANGNHQGWIEVRQAGDLTFSGGNGGRAYAQLGNGGYNANGDHNSNISITSAGNLSFSGGSGYSANALLGNGGLGADGSHSGDITLQDLGHLSFSGGSGNNAFAQLGLGGYSADGSHTGNIELTNVGDLSFKSENNGLRAYSQLGHGGDDADGSHSGDIILSGTGHMEFQGGANVGASAQIGHGGYWSKGDLSGAIHLSRTGNLMFSGGSNTRSYARLGHGGVDTDGSHSGDIRLSDTGYLDFVAGSGERTYAHLGHGDYFLNGSVTGDIDLSGIDAIRFQGGSGLRAYARLGHHGVNRNGDELRGDIFIDGSSSGFTSIEFLGGSAQEAYAQLGHGVDNYDTVVVGDIALTRVDALRFEGGFATDAYSQLGHGGVVLNGDYSGNIELHEVSDIRFSGGSEYALLGHGGLNRFGNDGLIRADGDIRLTGSGLHIDLADNARIGHYVVNQDSSSSGDIMLGDMSDLIQLNTYDSWLGHYSGSGKLEVYASSWNLFEGGQDYNNLIGGALENGTVWLWHENSVAIDHGIEYDSSNDFYLYTPNNIEFRFDGSIKNSGVGDITLITDSRFLNHDYNNVIETEGNWWLYSVNPLDNEADIHSLHYNQLIYGVQYDSYYSFGDHFDHSGGDYHSGGTLVYAVQPTIVSIDIDSWDNYVYGDLYEWDADRVDYRLAVEVNGTIKDGDVFGLDRSRADVRFSSDVPISRAGYVEAGTHENALEIMLREVDGIGPASGGTLIVEQKPLYLSVEQTDDKTYDGTTTATVTIDGNWEHFDDVWVMGNHAFEDKNVGSGKTVVSSNLQLSGYDSHNYRLDDDSLTSSADILPKVLTVTSQASDKVYDGSTDAAVIFSSDKLADDEVIVLADSAFDDKNVGTNKTVTSSSLVLSGADSSNYSLIQSSLTALADILAKILTVSVQDHTREADGNPYSGGNGVSYSGFVNGENEEQLLGELTYGGSAQGAVQSGVYVLTVEGLESNNYQIRYESGTLELVLPTAQEDDVPLETVYLEDTASVDAPTSNDGELVVSPSLSGSGQGLVEYEAENSEAPESIDENTSEEVAGTEPESQTSSQSSTDDNSEQDDTSSNDCDNDEEGANCSGD